MTTPPNQGSTPPPSQSNPTQEPRPVHRGWSIAVATVVSFALVVGLIWLFWGDSSGAAPGTPAANSTKTSATSVAPSATPTSVTPTATNGSTPAPATNAPAAAPAAGVNPDCPKQPRPVLPAHWLGQTLHAPGTDQPFYDALPPLQAAGVNVIAYMGEALEVGAASDAVGAVWCNDMSSAYGLDSTFNKIGYDGTKSFIKQLIAARPGAVRLWIVGQNDNGKTGLDAQRAETNARVAAIRSLHTGIKVQALTDQFSTNLAENVAEVGKFKADSHGIAYFPYQGSKVYGDESSLPTDARTVQQLDGANAIAVSQDLSWWNVDPAFAKAMGFAHGPIKNGVADETIKPAAVTALAKRQTDVALTPVLLVSQEDVVNKPPTEEDNVTGFLVPNVVAVKAAIPGLGR